MFSILQWLTITTKKNLHFNIQNLFFFFKILFIYSWETQRERQRHRQREKQAPWGDPDVGLNPRIPGSRPEPKADAQPLSHPGAPYKTLLNQNNCSSSFFIFLRFYSRLEQRGRDKKTPHWVQSLMQGQFQDPETMSRAETRSQMPNSATQAPQTFCILKQFLLYLYRVFSQVDQFLNFSFCSYRKFRFIYAGEE